MPVAYKIQTGKLTAITVKSVWCLFLFVWSFSINAQVPKNNFLYGTVTDESGEPLLGVNLILGKSPNLIGTMTGMDGSYRFDTLSIGMHTLKSSFVGYLSAEETVTIVPDIPTLKNIQLTKSSIELNSIQVTAKSASARIKEQSYEVELVETKGLGNTVADAKSILNAVSGIRIAEEGGMGSNATFSLNGFTGNQVKFFLDGISMDNFGSSMNMGDLPVNMIKNIEVYKGVVPIWLGNDALGGAVNIRTQTSPKFMDVSYAFGSFNTHRISVNGAYTWQNGFTVRSNLFYNYSDNNYKVYVAKGNGDQEKKWYPRFHDRYQSATAKLELGVAEKSYADNLLLGIIVTGNKKQLQTGTTMSKVYGGVHSESQSLICTLKYNKKDLFTKGLNINLHGVYSRNESHGIDTLRGTSYDWSGESKVLSGSNNGEIGDRTFTIFNIGDLTGQFNAEYALSSASFLSLNYALSDYHRTVSDSLNPENEYNFFPKKMQKQTLGLSYKYDWQQRWSTTVFAKYYYLKARTSKRYDQFLTTERVEELTSRAGNVGYGLATGFFVTPNIQLKLSYEKAYRMPTPGEMFGNGLFVNPNPDIKPESSDNTNLSVDFLNLKLHNQEIQFGLSLLHRNANNLIYEKVSPGSPESSFANSLKIRFLGAEGSFHYDYKDWYHLSTNITFQDITDRAEKILIKQVSGDYWQTNYSYGFRLPNRPYLFGNLNTGLSFSDLLQQDTKLSFDYFLNFTEHYFLTWVEMGTNNDKYIIPRQWSQDILLSYSFEGGRYTISAMCTNLTNALLYDKYYLQKPGRAFNVKLRISI